MSQSVPVVPDGYQGAIPYLIIKDAAALDFYQRSLGASQLMQPDERDGKVTHAEIAIGPARVRRYEKNPAMHAQSPLSLGGTPVSLHLYVDDVDGFVERAKTANMEVLRPVADQFYGDRGGVLEDPYGHVWSVATHIEDLSEDGIKRRAAALFD